MQVFGGFSMQILEPKLLIADDDRDFRESLSEVFRRRGFTTCLAADGQEALEIVNCSSELHLVILDIHMPRLSGLEALQQLRWSRSALLPCILMSAELDESIVREAAPLKPAGMLSKPFTLRTLTTTVETVLRNCYGWKI
jgi:DNA-binding response OmpR family regulator